MSHYISRHKYLAKERRQKKLYSLRYKDYTVYFSLPENVSKSITLDDLKVIDYKYCKKQPDFIEHAVDEWWSWHNIATLERAKKIMSIIPEIFPDSSQVQICESIYDGDFCEERIIEL